MSYIKRTFSYTLVGLLTFQPAIVSAGVVVDKNAAKANQAILDKAGNGIDIVNITKPSAKGVSHNKFSELDIGSQGLIFNNANVITATDLAGYIEGNPQLTAGSASIILNEVTSANRSLLEGYAEIAGQSADFILANPNGITCNGCGFINTPRATLTTGTPNFLNGGLDGFSISGGDVELGGLNSSNIDRLDILTRALVLNDELHAKELNIITGRNDVDYDSLRVTELADDGSTKPAFSLDTAALGGMYANSITLIGTEEGVGVNVAGELSASAGNIELTVNGDIVFANKVQAAESIALNTTKDITVGDNLLSEDGSILIVADHLENNAAINAEAGLDVNADTVINNQSISASTITLNLNERFENNGSVIASDSAIVAANSARIENNRDSQLAASELTITGNELINRGNIQGSSRLEVSVTNNITNQAIIQTDAEDAFISAGGVIDNSCDDTDTYCGNIAHAGQGQLTISAQGVNNERATIASNGKLSIVADQLSNQQGNINAEEIDGTLLDVNNNSGTLTADTLSLNTQTLSNNYNGTITGNNQLNLRASVELQNNDGGRIQTNANNASIYSGGQLTNRKGSIIHSGTGELQLTANTLDGTEGAIASNGVARIAVSNLDNTDGNLQAESISITSANVINDGGSFIADIVSIAADWISNVDGLLRGVDELDITVTQNLDNTQGIIQTNQENVAISVSNILTNTQGQITHAGNGTLSLQSAQLDNQQGTIASNGTIAVTTTDLDNSSGTINAVTITANNLSINNDNGVISADNLSLSTTDFSNVSGELTGVNALTISSTSGLDNTDGDIRTNAAHAAISSGGELNNTRGEIVHAGSGKLDLDVTTFTNIQGSVVSNGEVEITASRLDNSEGVLNATDVTVIATDVINHDGDMVADNLAIQATTLSNSKGEITGVEALSLTVSDSLDNTNGLIQTNADDVVITAGNSLTNTDGTITHAGTGTLSVTASAVTNSGTIASNGSIDVNTTSLNNTNGKLDASQRINVANGSDTASLVSDGGSIIGDMVTLATQWLSNIGGTIAGITGLSISTESDLINDNGVIQTAQANFSLTTPGDFSNQNGQVLHLGSGELAFDVTGTLNNTTGLLQSKGDLVLSASNAVNDNGLWVATGNIALTSAGLSNVGGGIYGVGDFSNVTINIGNNIINNSNGVITGSDQVSVIANTITNNGGTIWSDNALTLDLYSAASGGVIGGYNQLNLITDIDYQNAAGTKLLTTGGLNITTLGAFINEGEISVQDNFYLSATGLTNTSGGIIASAKDISLNITGNVNNQGRLSAARNLTINAVDITNTGTLGAGSDLGITANSISNGNNSLLFSGNNMSLALVQNLTNNYGTLFANNNIDITSSTGQVENISGTINAYNGNLSIAANAIINRKSQFSVSSSLTSNSGVNYWCTDCSGDNYTWYWEAYSYYTDVISQDSPTAYLLSGADMTLVGGSITNEYSAITAVGDLTMTGDSLTNVGYAGGEKTVYERWKARTTDGTYRRMQSDHLYPAGLSEQYEARISKFTVTRYRPLDNWNQLRLTSKPIPSWMRQFNRTHYTETYTAGSQATGTIQAGGSITGSFTGQIDNVNIAEYTTTPSNIGVETLDSSTTQGQRASINPINFQDSDAQLSSVGDVSNNNSVQSVADGQSTITAVVDNDDVDRVNANTAIAITDLLPQRGTGVFTITPEANHPYLVESDPLFADYGNFISSDYLLGRLGIDTDGITKRLGDGYYETQLVRQAAYNATGQVAHIGFGSELNWMQSLMDNAVAQSELLDFSFGISLTDEQVSALTQDMIWMVEREVEGQLVLVPELYLASVNENSIARGGAVITGDSVQLMTAAGDINNSGALSSQDLFLQSDKGINNRGALIANNALEVESRTDIANIGGSMRGENVSLVSREGSIQNKTEVTQTEWGKTWRGEAGHITTQVGHRASITADNNLSLGANKSIDIAASDVTSGGNAELNAGEGITITAVQTRDRHAYSWRNGHMMEDTISHETSELTVANNLTLNAGKDIEISGSQVTAGNDVSIRTQRDLTVSSVQDEHHYEFYEKDEGSFGRSSEVLIRKDSITQQGSLIKAGGDLMINTAKTEAGIAANDSRDVTITASKAEAGQDLIAHAGRNLTVDAAENMTSSYVYKQKSSGGLSGKSKTTINSNAQTTSVVSVLSAGGETQLIAGEDQSLQGAQVVSEGDLSLAAGGDITLSSAQDTASSYHYEKKTKSGIFASGGSITVGSQKQSQSTDTQEVIQRGTLIGSLQGDVSIAANDDVTVTASEAFADGDVHIEGKNVTLNHAYNTYTQEQKQEFKQSGVSLSVSAKGVETAKEFSHSIERGGEVEDERLQALYALRAARLAEDLHELKDTAEAIANGDFTKAGVEVSISVGSSKSESHSINEVHNAVGSRVNAGGTAEVIARGEAANDVAGNITAIGSEINGDTVSLQAANDITLAAAKNQNDYNSENSSSGWAVGLKVAVGQGEGGKNGLSIFANGNKGEGYTHSSNDQYLETDINGRDVTIVADNDTLLEGARIKGDKVSLQTGGDLTIRSQQDESTYESEQKHASAGVSVGIGSQAPVSVNLAYSQTEIEAEHRSVQEQSGIFAGEDGFDVQVGGNTELKGAVIVAEGESANNRLETASLSYDELENVSRYDAKSVSISVSTSFNQSEGDGNSPMGIGGGAASDSDEASSTTRSAISQATITVAGKEIDQNSLDGLADNADDAHTPLENVFDAEEVQRDLEETRELVEVFSEEAYRRVGDYYQEHENAKDELKAARKAEKEGKPYPVDIEELEARVEETKPAISKELAHAIVGGIATSLGGGDFASGAAAAGVNELVNQKLGDALPDDAETRNALAVILGAAASSAVGGSSVDGGLIAGNADKFNRQLHKTEVEWLKDNIQGYADERGITAQDAEAELMATAQAMNDEEWAKQLANDPNVTESAKQYISKNAQTITFIDDQGNKRFMLTSTEDEYKNGDMYLYQYGDIKDDLYKPKETIGDIVEKNWDLVTAAATVHGTAKEIYESGDDLYQTSKALLDAENYEKAIAFYDWAKEHPQEAEQALIEALPELAEDFKRDLLTEIYRHDLYEDQNRYYDKQVEEVQDGLSVVNPFKKLAAIGALPAVVNKLPDMRGDAATDLADGGVGNRGPDGPDSGHANAKPDDRVGDTGPYDPNKKREDLEHVFGEENVTSTTNPKDPLQRVNSNPEKGVEVITDSYGNKAVRVKYEDPVTGESTTANIPYDSRGLVVFDDHTKFTTRIDKSVDYDSQFPQATRDLKSAIARGDVSTDDFTPLQLKQINAEKPKIQGFTWHHDASGKMQLVPTDVHKAVSHIGDALDKGK
ncbi:hypothetical protein R50073_48290 [Maricurvus nonylphenolicus]|uniref:hemagglutinin repeat-containing protein n=1 Tax=Maricurvus nonylphenolicus TaxID=1008307 RepID=UPI0036F1B8AA